MEGNMEKADKCKNCGQKFNLPNMHRNSYKQSMWVTEYADGYCKDCYINVLENKILKLKKALVIIGKKLTRLKIKIGMIFVTN